ncbi:hypothetical protein A2W24_01665 [Microgenomates group bacterium RBG_16_45_19]|nr:MAG: hypothetical protein A2W24_01665 [Microgenomates group bacterium RBG_16_45_19]
MNVEVVLKELGQKFPGEKIFRNDEKQPTEIICEIEPTSEHPEYSVAVAVIDRSAPHFHHKTEEVYEVLKGELDLYIDGKQLKLKKGEKYTIKPGIKHCAVGQETWIKVTARPGWKIEDHILI